MGLSVEQVRRAQSLGGRIGAAKKHLLFGGPSMAVSDTSPSRSSTYAKNFIT